MQKPFLEWDEQQQCSIADTLVSNFQVPIKLAIKMVKVLNEQNPLLKYENEQWIFCSIGEFNKFDYAIMELKEELPF